MRTLLGTILVFVCIQSNSLTITSLVISTKRRLNLHIQKLVKKEIIKWLDVGNIHTIVNSSWVYPVQCMLKKGGITVVPNVNNDLVPMLSIIVWKVCIDYHKLNAWIEKNHFHMSFIDHMLDLFAGKGWYFLLDGYQATIRFP